MTDKLTAACTSLEPQELTRQAGPTSGVRKQLDAWNEAHDSDALQSHVTACFRHNGWKHLRSLVYASLHRTGQSQNRLLAFDSCGFASYVARSLEQPYRYRLLGSTCKDRFCTPCARDRARTVTANALDVLEGRRVRFVTLTIKTPGLALADALAKLDKAFGDLRRRRFWQRHVLGGIGFTEVTWSERGNRWHPHIHALTCGRFMPQPMLKAEWKAVTQDSQIVDIRLVEGPRQILQYVTKYVGKGLDTSYARDPDLLDEAVLALKGRRLLTTFGIFRGVALTKPSDAGDWENLGTLWEFLLKAKDGDKESRAILDALDAQATSAAIGLLDERAPPPSVSPSHAPPSEPDLFGSRTWFS